MTQVCNSIHTGSWDRKTARSRAGWEAQWGPTSGYKGKGGLGWGSVEEHLPATLKTLGSIPDATNSGIVLKHDNTQLHGSVALFLGAVVARVVACYLVYIYLQVLWRCSWLHPCVWRDKPLWKNNITKLEVGESSFHSFFFIFLLCFKFCKTKWGQKPLRFF